MYVGSGFPCKVAWEMITGDNGKLFILFIPLFTLFLGNKIVCSLWFHPYPSKMGWKHCEMHKEGTATSGHWSNVIVWCSAKQAKSTTDLAAFKRWRIQCNVIALSWRIVFFCMVMSHLFRPVLMSRTIYPSVEAKYTLTPPKNCHLWFRGVRNVSFAAFLWSLKDHGSLFLILTFNRRFGVDCALSSIG